MSSAGPRPWRRTAGSRGIEDAKAGDTSLRVLTQPLAGGTAIQVARSLEDTNHTLNTLIIILAAVSAGGIALAAALGPVVARAALAPAGEVSDAAEEVAETHDLTHRIEVRGDDELGRLAASFNEMMAALERSEAAQRRLVADASHELRTPLATLRTNIETLGRSDGLDPEERKRLVADVTAGARGDDRAGRRRGRAGARAGPGCDRPAGRRAGRARARRDRARRAAGARESASSGTSIPPWSTPTRSGSAGRSRTCSTTPPSGARRGADRGGRRRAGGSPSATTVRAFRTGDLDKVFDRFWRADEARGKPGSGLGLAIVQRVAEEHGGSARASNAADGGRGGQPASCPSCPPRPS